MERFNRENIGDYTHWPRYKKKTLTYMRRMEGPFVIETSKGDLKCEDGFLAVDARGYPYPIAADEQTIIYELVD